MNNQQIVPVIGNEFPEKVRPLIEQAKDTIDIVVYSWHWYPDQVGSAIQKFNNAIINVAKKGIRVRVMTNDHSTINVLSQNKVKARKLDTNRKVHVKLIVIDGKIAILGSHNYTMNAFTTNYEVSVITQDIELVKRLKKFFNNLWPGI